MLFDVSPRFATSNPKRRFVPGPGDYEHASLAKSISANSNHQELRYKSQARDSFLTGSVTGEFFYFRARESPLIQSRRGPGMYEVSRELANGPNFNVRARESLRRQRHKTFNDAS
jgi:hypothetical protein